MTGGKGAWRGGEGALGESIEEGARGGGVGGGTGRSITHVFPRALLLEARLGGGVVAHVRAGGAGDGGAGGGIAAFAVARPRRRHLVSLLLDEALRHRPQHLGHERGSGPRPIHPRFGSSWTREGDCTRSGERAASADRSWRDRRGASCPPRSGHAPSPRGQPSRRAIDCGTPELATAHLTNRASVRCPPTTRSVDSSQTNIRRRERLTPMSWNSSGAPRLPGSSHPYARGALARNDRDDDMTFA